MTPEQKVAAMYDIDSSSEAPTPPPGVVDTNDDKLEDFIKNDPCYDEMGCSSDKNCSEKELEDEKVLEYYTLKNGKIPSLIKFQMEAVKRKRAGENEFKGDDAMLKRWEKSKRICKHCTTSSSTGKKYCITAKTKALIDPPTNNPNADIFGRATARRAGAVIMTLDDNLEKYFFKATGNSIYSIYLKKLKDEIKKCLHLKEAIIGMPDTTGYHIMFTYKGIAYKLHVPFPGVQKDTINAEMLEGKNEQSAFVIPHFPVRDGMGTLVAAKMGDSDAKITNACKQASGKKLTVFSLGLESCDLNRRENCAKTEYYITLGPLTDDLSYSNYESSESGIYEQTLPGRVRGRAPEDKPRDFEVVRQCINKLIGTVLVPLIPLFQQAQEYYAKKDVDNLRLLVALTASGAGGVWLGPGGPGNSGDKSGGRRRRTRHKRKKRRKTRRKRKSKKTRRRKIRKKRRKHTRRKHTRRKHTRRK